MSYTKEDILRLAEEDDVEFIRMQFTDIFGQLKNVAITRPQLEKAVNNRIEIDGSSIAGFARQYESDQLLYPDLDTYSLLPWRPQHGKVARLICDVHSVNGEPFEGDPRLVLKRQLKRAAELGYTFKASPECEFFLFETDENGRPTTRTGDEAGYFDMAPLDHGSNTRREICLSLEKMGFEVEASHHEVAGGQHEIDFHYTDALRTADNIMTFRLAVKSIAQKNGLHATFMPKPLYGVNGSGMHTNFSLFKDGKNSFYDENDSLQLSKEAYSFMAGIIKHARGIAAVTNPLVNSYKRLIPGYEAPCYLGWSASNRSTLLRVPAYRGENTWIEFRSPDPSCNPYLALAVCIAAGLDGIKNNLEAPEETKTNIYEMSLKELIASGVETLPSSLDDALREMEADPLVAETLGEHVYKKYLAGKWKEWEEYSSQVSKWELDRYMINY